MALNPPRPKVNTLHPMSRLQTAVRSAKRSLGQAERLREQLINNPDLLNREDTLKEIDRLVADARVKVDLAIQLNAEHNLGFGTLPSVGA